MTAYGIYKGALAHIFEKDGEDRRFKEMFCPILSALLAESLVYENSIRESEGKEKLLSAPVAESMEDEIPYSEALCRIALPLGVAAYFMQDDGEARKSAIFRERFVDALNEAAKWNAGEVIDVYGGEA